MTGKERGAEQRLMGELTVNLLFTAEPAYASLQHLPLQSCQSWGVHGAFFQLRAFTHTVPSTLRLVANHFLVFLSQMNG